MPRLPLHPLRIHPTLRFQPRQKRVDRSFRNEQVRAISHPPQDLQSIQRSGPETGHDGEIEGAFAELDLPFIDRTPCHALYSAIQDIMLSTCSCLVRPSTTPTG